MSNQMGEQLNLALALEGRSKAAPENEQLLVIADAIAALPDPEIDPAFMMALEQRLMTEGLEEQQGRHLHAVPVEAPAAEPIRRAPVVRMPKRRFVVRRSIAAVAAAASLAAFPVAAAASSLPGSPFYGLKTRIERMQIALIGTPVEDGLRYLSLFNTRMGEVDQLIAIDARPELIATTLAEAARDLRIGSALILDNTSDPAVLERLGEQARAAEIRLRGTAPSLSPSAEPELTGAIDTSIGIQDAVARALGLDGVTPAIPSAATATIVSRSGQTTTTGSTGTAASTPTRSTLNGGEKNSSDVQDGAGKALSDATEGCEVPGSGDGLGDLGAPLAKIMCM